MAEGEDSDAPSLEDGVVSNPDPEVNAPQDSELSHPTAAANATSEPEPTPAQTPEDIEAMVKEKAEKAEKEAQEDLRKQEHENAMAEIENARKAAEEEIAKLKAETESQIAAVETERLRAQEEATPRAAEDKARRLAEAELAQAKQQAEAELEAARLEAQQAQEALAVEAERLRAEQEAAGRAAEEEARRAAEAQLEEAKKQAEADLEAARLEAQQAQEALAAEAERARAEAEAEKAAKQTPVSDTTKIIGKEASLESKPLAPKFGTLSKTKITEIHSLGDLHGWAPGLISYLIENQLAEISIDGYPMQDDKGRIHKKNMNEAFPNPILNFPSLPKAGLKDQPFGNWYGVQDGGHGAIKARWIAQPHVALVQVGDIFDRADHSELAAEIMRQLIIDAPGRVFALVGNHEQFMLENDFQNWAHNEVRSAYVDDVKPKPGTKAHYRFFNQGVSQQKAMEEVFERYKVSTWTLFLTQGAIFEKLGWLKSTPSWELSKMLSPGWEPYNYAGRYMDGHKQGEEIPGALTALVLNDVLFHHGEPAAHKEDANGNRLNLHASMTRVSKNKSFEDLRLQMYRHGGYSLQSSPDQPLLWARGSSSGANTGLPAAEQHLSDLVTRWTGLHRIVHGHTPTVGASEFRAQTNGQSTTVSYLADSSSSESSKGRANKVRVHNIDEGMSPVYFNHTADDAYDPCRVPVGLRIENDEFSAVEAAKPNSKLIELELKASMDEDRRKLWKWSPGQWRTNAQETWSQHNKIYTKPVQFKDWRGFIFVQESGSSKKAMETLQRRVMGPTVSDLLIQQVLRATDSKIQVETLPAMLERVQPIGKELFKDQAYRAFADSKIALLIARPNKQNMQICAYNGFDHAQRFEHGQRGFKGSFKSTEWTLASNTGESKTIKNPSFAYIGLPKTTKSAYGVNEEDKSASRTRIMPSIGYKFEGNAEKVATMKAREINLNGKPRPPPKPKKWQASPSHGHPSRSNTGSLGDQGSQNQRNKAWQDDNLRNQSRDSSTPSTGKNDLGSQGSPATSNTGDDKGKAGEERGRSPNSSKPSGRTTSSGGSSPRNDKQTLKDQGNDQVKNDETQEQKNQKVMNRRRTGLKISEQSVSQLVVSFNDSPGRAFKKGWLKVQKDGRDFCQINFTYQHGTNRLILRVQKLGWKDEIELITVDENQKVLSWPEHTPQLEKGVAPPQAFQEFWDEFSKEKQKIINLATSLLVIVRK